MTEPITTNEPAPKKRRRRKQKKGVRRVNLSEAALAQFNAFLADAVVPITTRPQIKFPALYAAYRRYCKEIEVVPEIGERQFKLKLHQHIFCKILHGYKIYFCQLRDIYKEEV
jgi:hypothetical protein